MRISIIGSGYVGLVSGACFAEKGHEVLCIDSDERKINLLRSGELPFYEPDLKELVSKNIKENRLRFASTIKEAVDFGLAIFIAVGTPSKEDGSADLSYVENVAREIAENLKEYRVIVDKSTVPVETGDRVEQTIKYNDKNGIDFDVVSNPEFLKEGSAIKDAFNPDRIVIGTSSEKAVDIMKEIYAPWENPNIIVTDIKSAELIKHASNSFLAAKISYINAIARICELTGADVEKVAEGIGCDRRIGKEFLNAGIGYGGSCFPKDVAAFSWIAQKYGYEFNFLKAVEEINEGQWRHYLTKVEDALWVLKDKTIAVLGLSFKPNTDDLRNAPSMKIISWLRNEGANVNAYDPVAMEKAEEMIKDVAYCKDPYIALDGANAALIITEWDEIKSLDLDRAKEFMKDPVIIDGRNVFSPEIMKEKGFRYYSMGRSI